MSQSQSHQQNSSDKDNSSPQDQQPEAGTRDFEEEEIRQSSPMNRRMSDKSEEAPEEA
ncbi:MAG TPA: hypothetical protein V6C64_04300 [Microcoleaceae cyanobacterium]|jgi:hypothetical protein